MKKQNPHRTSNNFFNDLNSMLQIPTYFLSLIPAVLTVSAFPETPTVT